jgi:hypothetical protein
MAHDFIGPAERRGGLSLFQGREPWIALPLEVARVTGSSEHTTRQGQMIQSD